MSEELEQNDGTWSSLKKTIVGTIATLITGGGTYLGVMLFGGGHEEAPAPVQQAAPAPVINITNTNQQQQSSGGTTVVVKEKTVEKPAPVKKKEGDEFKQEEPKW